MNKAILGFIIVSIVLISGCVGESPTGQVTQYVCPDGSIVSDASLCSKQETQIQTPECISDWECSDWSECSSFGTQTRKCIDNNNCGVVTDKPAESQSCTLSIIEPKPITITGTGQQASSKFTLEEGLSIFEMTHSGSSNFIVHLLDNNGDITEFLANEIGRYGGSKAVGVQEAGEYLFDINADGTWIINIKQPRLNSAEPVPKVFVGKSNDVSEFFYLNKGLTRFELKHGGTSNFIVHLLDSQGDIIEFMVNEIGSFDGSKALGIKKSGIYLLDITADGDWEISVE